MEQMIAEYEKTRDRLAGRIAELEERLRTEQLPTMEREQLIRRIVCLEEERYELLLSLLTMCDREGGQR